VLALGRLAHNKGSIYLWALRSLRRASRCATGTSQVRGNRLQPEGAQLRRRLKALAPNLNLADKVHFGSYIADCRSRRLVLVRPIVFVLSSRYEPFGMTRSKAMASAAPIGGHNSRRSLSCSGRLAGHALLWPTALDREDSASPSLRCSDGRPRNVSPPSGSH